MKFENEWLARYPKPVRVVFDHGGEFVGATFQSMLITNGIEPRPTTAKNPQSNAVCERMHKTVGDILRTHVPEMKVDNIDNAQQLIDTALASASYALRATANSTFGVSPGALIFQCDMQINIPILANYEMIRQRRQAKIDYNADRENSKRRFRDYAVGDEVMILVDRPGKLDERAHGPYVVQQTHTNGTVTILRTAGVYERINIRRIKPYSR